MTYSERPKSYKILNQITNSIFPLNFYRTNLELIRTDVLSRAVLLRNASSVACKHKTTFTGTNFAWGSDANSVALFLEITTARHTSARAGNRLLAFWAI